MSGGRAPRAVSGGHAHRWALALVAAVHLLALAGHWWITDHGEMLHLARRVLTRGTYSLRAAGETAGWLPHWPNPGSSSPERSRFVPGTPLTMVPLLFLDHALGWEDERQFGRLVHLQGELFVLAALALVARTVRAAGHSDQAAAVGVVLAGFSWPLWMVARRVGPEPVVAFLVALYLAGLTGRGTHEGPGGGRSRGAWRRALACAALPWVHATGPLVALALALVELTGGRSPSSRDPALVARDREARRLVLLAAAFGLASWVLAWNHLYHGNWWGGGYAQHTGSDPFFRTHHPLLGLWRHGREMALQTALLLVVVFLGWRRGARAPSLRAALLLTAVLLAFFAPFGSEEPARRLSPTVPAWGAAAGCAWDRVRWRPFAAQALVSLAIPLGAWWLLAAGGSFQQTPWGLHYGPQIVWLRCARAGGSPWLAIGVPVVLLAVALVALGRVHAGLRSAAPARLPQGTS